MTFAGGCACGQARYGFDADPINVRICHCGLCRKATGAPFFARALFPLAALSRTGETVGHNSSPRIWRASCARCGTAIYSEPNNDPPRIAVGIATLDDPEALPPAIHIWTSSKLGWVDIEDGRPQYPEGAPHDAHPYRPPK